MPRRRLGVVLLVPAPFATEIDGLRRACGGRSAIDHVAPHVTLVPPVNVRVDEIGEALAVLRDGAASRAGTGGLALTLGPAATFLPASDTLYLAVGADDGLTALRDAVFQPPLSRVLEWPFVPHVTLAEGLGPERTAAALTALADYSVSVVVDRVYLLEDVPRRRRQADLHQGDRRWVPVADAPLAAPAVVGRGGIELELSRSRLVDPEARELVDEPPSLPPAGAEPRVVTARRRGRVVGVAHGWVRDGDPELVHVEVVEDQRGLGISRQLRLAFATTDA